MDFRNKIIGAPLTAEPIEAGTTFEPEMTEAFKYGFTRVDAMKSAMQQDSLFVMLGENSSINKNAFDIDKEWNKEEARLSLQSTIHPKMLDNMMEEARSERHLEAMIPEWEKDSAARRYQESLPWYEDFGYAAMAELTNAPVYILGSMAAMSTAPLSVGVLGSTLAGRALIEGTAGLGVEAIKDVVGKHDKDYIDYASAFIFDGTVGAMFGKSRGDFIDYVKKDMLDTAGITEEVARAMGKATTDAERKSIADKAFADKTGKELSMDGYQQLDAQIKKGGKATGLWEAARQDLAYITGKSESQTIQGFSQQMFPDPTLQHLNKEKRDMQTLRDRLEQRMEGTIQQEFQPIIKEFSNKILKSFGFLGIRPSGSAEETFGKLIGDIQKYKDMANRTGSTYDMDTLIENAIKKNGYSQSKELNDIIKQGVQAAERVSLKYHNMLKESGNTKFQEGGIKESSDFYHYSYDRKKITDLINSGVKEKDMIKFFENAIHSYLAKGGKKITPENVEKAAYMFYRGVSESKTETSTSFKNIIDDALSSKDLKSEDKEFFQSLVEDKPSGKPDEEAGVAMRERSAIDYGYKGKVLGANGKIYDLSMMDLVSSDYFASTRKYYRRSSGTTALQQIKWNTKESFISDEKLLQSIENNPDLMQLLQNKAEIDAIKTQIEQLGINPDDIIQGIKNLDVPEDIAKFIETIEKQLVDSRELDTTIGNLRSKLMKEAGFIEKNVKQYSDEFYKKFNELDAAQFELTKMKRNGAPKQVLESLERKIKDIQRSIEAKIDDARLEYGDKAIDIHDIAKKIHRKYSMAGKESRDIADRAFKKQYPDKRLDRRTSAYKEIRKGIQRKITVETGKYTDELNQIYKDAITKKNRVEGEERTLSSNQDIRDFIQQSTDEMQDKVSRNKMSEKDMKKELVRLEHIMKDMQGLPTAKDPDSFAHTAQRLMSSMNIFRLLGQTGFTMSAEMASVAVDSGLKNMLKTMPEFGSILKAYKSGKLDDPFIKELQEETGMFTEFLSSPRSYELAHDYSPNGWDGFAKKAQDTVDSMAEFTLMMGGIKPLSAMFKAAHAKGIFTKMKEVVNGKVPDDSYMKMLNELGLSKQSVEDIYGNILAFSDKNGKMMNFSSWDVQTKNLFMDAVVRRSDTIIQQKRLGDTMGWVTGDHLLQSSALGKFLLELKTFSLVAYTKQLGRVLNRADLHSAMLVTSWGAALSLSYMAKVHYNYAGNQEKLEKALEPDVMFASVVGQMPLASIIPEILNTVGSVTGLGTPFGHSRHSGVATDFMSILPSIDLLNNIGKTISEPIGALIDGEVESRHFAPAAKVFGAKNNMILRPFTEAALK